MHKAFVLHFFEKDFCRHRAFAFCLAADVVGIRSGEEVKDFGDVFIPCHAKDAEQWFLSGPRFEVPGQVYPSTGIVPCVYDNAWGGFLDDL